jgi:glutathione S-transferase
MGTGRREEWYLKANHGRVPLLETPEGEFVNETNIMFDYGINHPDGILVPDGELGGLLF